MKKRRQSDAPTVSWAEKKLGLRRSPGYDRAGKKVYVRADMTLTGGGTMPPYIQHLKFGDASP